MNSLKRKLEIKHFTSEDNKNHNKNRDKQTIGEKSIQRKVETFTSRVTYIQKQLQDVIIGHSTECTGHITDFTGSSAQPTPRGFTDLMYILPLTMLLLLQYSQNLSHTNTPATLYKLTNEREASKLQLEYRL